jgi:predicted secreted protein
MSLAIGIAIYFICWWLAFFIVLPLGVRTHEEPGLIEPGLADSAPIDAHLWKKALAATIISALIYGVTYAVIAHRLIPLDRIPMSF